MEEGEQARQLAAAVGHAAITAGELWLRYFSIGGRAGEYEVEAYLHGLHSLPVLQRDLLAQAANELIDELPPLPRAPYSDSSQLVDNNRCDDVSSTETGQTDPDAG